MKSKELEKVLELMDSRPVREDMTIQERRSVMEAAPGFPLAEDVIYEKVNAAGVPGEWIGISGTESPRVILHLSVAFTI